MAQSARRPWPQARSLGLKAVPCPDRIGLGQGLGSVRRRGTGVTAVTVLVRKGGTPAEEGGPGQKEEEEEEEEEEVVVVVVVET